MGCAVDPFGPGAEPLGRAVVPLWRVVVPVGRGVVLEEAKGSPRRAIDGSVLR